MFKRTWIAAALLVSVAVPASAMARDAIDELLAKATEKYQDRGYSDAGWTQRGSLAQGEERTLTVTLQAGESYQLIGMCDQECSNLDAALLDSGGNVVSSDTQADDFPIVGITPQASGTYTVKLQMVTCSGGGCAFGARLFRKNG